MDEVEEVDELGPVDWIVVEFPGQQVQRVDRTCAARSGRT